MKQSHDYDEKPDARLLAAYLDGELDDRPETAALCRRLQAWLEQHPDGAADAQRLCKLWRETAPPEPSRAAWDATLDRIAGAARQRAMAPAPTAARKPVAVACAVGLVLLAGLLGAALSWPTPVRPVVPEQVATPGPTHSGMKHADEEVFPVAQADEVTILRVDGEDMATLVVGEFPVQGLLELADPGEIRVLRVRPDQRDQKLPHVQQGGTHRPMIWARLDTEND